MLIALVIFDGVYLAEIVRAGIAAVPKGQFEAARSLGLGYVGAMRRVILPQALRHMLPSLVNQFVATIKETRRPGAAGRNLSLPANTLQELIALAKAQPGKLNFASGGTGGSTHLAGELFNRMAGVDIVYVTFKGSASTIQALMSGDLTISSGDFATYLPLIEAGKLRAVAVASTRRFPAVSQIPTKQGAGLPGFEIDAWLGIAAVGETPQPIVRRLSEAIRGDGSPCDTWRFIPSDARYRACSNARVVQTWHRRFNEISDLTTRLPRIAEIGPGVDLVSVNLTYCATATLAHQTKSLIV